MTFVDRCRLHSQFEPAIWSCRGLSLTHYSPHDVGSFTQPFCDTCQRWLGVHAQSSTAHDRIRCPQCNNNNAISHQYRLALKLIDDRGNGLEKVSLLRENGVSLIFVVHTEIFLPCFLSNVLHRNNSLESKQAISTLRMSHESRCRMCFNKFWWIRSSDLIVTIWRSESIVACTCIGALYVTIQHHHRESPSSVCGIPSCSKTCANEREMDDHRFLLLLSFFFPHVLRFKLKSCSLDCHAHAVIPMINTNTTWALTIVLVP
jgi:hypothetical protein